MDSFLTLIGLRPPLPRSTVLPSASLFAVILPHLMKAHLFPNPYLALVCCYGYKNLNGHQTKELLEVPVRGTLLAKALL